MGQYTAVSGIKVLDRAVAIMAAVAPRPLSLTELCEATDLPRATTHRLASALETHRILARNVDGRWTTGPALASLGAGGQDQLIDAAIPIMSTLVDTTGESVQLYQLNGTSRSCIASQEPPSGLQNTVPVGSQLPLTSGSAAKIFLAHGSPQLRETLLIDAAFSPEEVAIARERGWSESVAERELGLASVSAPVFSSAGAFVAVLSVSGPAERLRPHPGQKWSSQLVAAARRLSESL
ncbi:IclR family transcriptional regulator [Corynebacterium alimapuense]|uniref:IclR family transcriptional regulator n=1 Tax=Corynebacterium alimapuense TaxID=1576874 RepID=A0A3M8K550_9CORY|nr:IclR family transcriptional regulator [Corynebacterium alimapuense]RNE48331.1 IclR family transcriptional regulator [Corynebacterium alimapuense]